MAAVGIPELIKGDWVKKDAIVIDVGINKTDKWNWLVMLHLMKFLKLQKL